MSNLAAQPDAPSDAELISRVRAGDQAAYGELFERHREAAHRMARQLVRGPDMDDLISEAFTKVLVQLQRGGGPDVAFRAYLLTSIRRLHVDRARTNQRVQVTDDLEDLDRGVDFVDPATSDFERGAASRAFTSLPERWQLVLWHLEVEGQKPADIAPLLGMSPNSVAALAYRAREGLRQAYLQSHLADTADQACRWTTERLGAYVRKGLAKRDSAKVEAHLDGCHRCTAVYLELTEVNSNLSGLLAPALLGLAAPGYLAATGTKIGLLLLWPWTKLKDAGAGAQAGAAGAAVAAVVAVAAVAGVFGGGGDDTNEASEPSTQQTAPDQKDSPPDNQQEPKNDDTPPDNQQQDPEPPPDEQPPPDEDAPEADEPPDDAPPPDVVPETPTDVTGDIRGSNVVLRWDPVDDARGYRVYRKSSPAAAATGVTAAGVTAAGLAASAEGPTNAVPATYSVAPSTTLTATVTATVTATTTPVAYPAAGPGAGPVVSDGVIQETSFRDNSLVDGNKYRYVVTAVGSGEESQVSEPVTVTYNPVPSAPTRVRASERNSGIALRWAANSEPDIDEYRILRDGEQVGTTSSPRFKDDSAVDGSTYTYSVVALDRSGQASGESGNVDATYDPAPSAPTGLSVDERGAKLALTWDENTEPDIDEYNVYRDGDKIASIDRPRYIDTDAPDGATTYTVTAVDASGQESTESGDATFDADPRRPRGVDATQVDSGIAVTWNDNAESDIDHYIVLRGGDEIATVTKPRYRDTAVVDGDSYAYRIVAVDDEGNESPRSRPARAAYDPAPDAPTGLTAKVRGNTIKLDWDDSTEPDLDKYIVYRDGKKLGSANQSHYTDSNPPDDATTYTVTAVDESGQESPESDAATIDVAPERPTGLTAVEIEGGIELTWNDNAELDIDHYIVIRGEDEVETVTEPRYVDDDVDDGDSYTYRIIAVDEADNESPRSRPAQAAYDPAPDAPTGLTAVEVNGGIELDWTENNEPDIAGYIVYRGEEPITGTIDEPTFVDEEASDGKSVYTVTAVDDSDQESERSRPAPADPRPEPPTGLTAVEIEGGIELTWNDNAESDIDGYIVYRDGIRIGTSSGRGDTSFEDETAVEGTQYRYSVAAVDRGDNESDRSQEVTAGWDEKPPMPTGLTWRMTGSVLHFMWNGPTQEDFDHYEVHLDGESLGPTTQPHATDPGHTGRYEHTLTVTAIDVAGNRSGTATLTFTHDDARERNLLGEDLGSDSRVQPDTDVGAQERNEPRSNRPERIQGFNLR